VGERAEERALLRWFTHGMDERTEEEPFLGWFNHRAGESKEEGGAPPLVQPPRGRANR
jgi:hypothetical protein